MRGLWATLGCIAVLGLGALPAQAAFDDPLPSFTPYVPTGSAALSDPCGLAVNAKGELYVSDYYHRAVDLFTPMPILLTRPLIAGGSTNPHTGLVDDPCGLALDGANTLYLNNYHRNAVRFPSPASLGTGTVLDTGDPANLFANPTGVAVNQATGDVYVNDRTYLAAYSSAGASLGKIGEGHIGDAYGIAVSGFPGTAGRVYVPDTSTETVKVFDPTVSATTPVATIAGPPGGFASLEDSAVAVDNTSGEVYVIDTLGRQFTEQPQASVYVFSSTGSFEGRLKFSIIDGGPSGIAVDNSGGENQGRVYVTSGNSAAAGIFAYPPGAATNVALPPPGLSIASGAHGSSGTDPVSPSAQAGASSVGALASTSQITQQGNLRLAVAGKLSPHKLPRKGVAPIAVSLGGQVSTTDGAGPPVMKTIAIEVNRNGHFDTTGLPLCPISRIQPASSSRALSNCRSSLVGEGSFTALAGFGETEAGERETYETKGRLLLFNGKKGNKPVLYGQIYASRPFASSFVIPFAVKKVSKGHYGTKLSATLPASLRNWGNLTGIEMKLSRRYAYQGKQHSYISAGCPTPKGFGAVTFPLVRATFGFEGGQNLSSTLTDQCKVRG